jgi:glucose-6-phosphate 1-dehydrogenase
MTSPLIMVIFGATGDLMHRKLIPAFYRLIQAGELSTDLIIVGAGRRKITTDQFREMMAASVQEAYPKQFNLKLWEKIIAHMEYQQGKFEDDHLYINLTTLLEKFDTDFRACVPRFFYLATPPQHYEHILNHLHKSKLSEGCGQGTSLYTRLLIEKPFGKDLETAQHLDLLLGKIFEERQIYRIDHYLGKETVQNILSFRFANGMFEPTWNNKFIDHIQITLAEDTGVGKRGMFYDGVGALRDVVQNHMLEMLAVTAMEQPRAFDAASIRSQRVKAIEAINCISPSDVALEVVRGQYEGYNREKDVDVHSATETFIALKLTLDTPRWKDVPFYIRTGRKMPKKATDISIHYKKPKVCYGDLCLFSEKNVLRNVVSIRIEPDEMITISLMAKKPGFTMNLTPVSMTFDYKEMFKENSPESYERLLVDAIRGDMTLFARTDGIAASWKFVTNILKGFEKPESKLFTYKPGTWGPKEANTLIEKDGRRWFLEE